MNQMTLPSRDKVGCIYEKTHLTLKKLQQEVSQRFIVALGVFNNIKSLPKSDRAKRIIFKMASKMAARLKKSNYLLINHPKRLILMHCHLFWV